MYANKAKESITFQKLGSRDFLQIVASVLNKGKSVIPPPINELEVLSPTSDKVKLLKTFIKTLILMTQASLYVFFFLELL